MTHYDHTVRKVNLDTGEEKMSDFTDENEVAAGGVVPADYASSHPELDTTGVNVGETVEVDGRVFVFDGENWRWLPDSSEMGFTAAGRFWSSLRYKVNVRSI